MHFIRLSLALEEVDPSHLLLRGVDERVDKQKICHRCGKSTKESHPLCNAEFCDPNSVERKTMDIFYLKPRQLDLLRNVPVKCAIEGPAGTGKTLVLLLKIINLVIEESAYNIILMTPFPHTVRCKTFLEDNNVEIQMEEAFPLHPLNACDRKHPSRPVVRIVDLKKFKKWCLPIDYDSDCSDNYRGYIGGYGDHIEVDAIDCLQEHVFVDDMQTVFNAYDDGVSESECIELLSKSCDMPNVDIYVWLAYDTAQNHGSFDLDSSFTNSIRKTIKTCFCTVNYYELNEVLRNAKPIIEALKEQYECSVSEVPIHLDGHSINGPPIDCHILMKSQKRRRKAYLKGTLQKYLTEWQDVPTAILHDGKSDRDISELCISVLEDLGKQVIDIEKYYEQRSTLKRDQIVVDSIKQVPSFEIPLAITVYSNCRKFVSGSDFTLTSRARSKHIFILINANSNDVHDVKRSSYPNARFTITGSERTCGCAII